MNEKQALILQTMRAMDSEFNRYEAWYPVVFKASTIAKRMGFKSANSIRADLYSLVDLGVVRMQVSHNLSGCVTCRTWFSLSARPAMKQLQFGKGFKS